MVKNPEWSALEDEVIIVKKFDALATVRNGRVSSTAINIPYAYVTINSPKLATETVLPITHRLDFLHLWEVFRIRTVSDAEEVLVHWSRKYDKWVFNLFPYFLPRLHIMICPEGTYSKLIDANWWKEAGGEAKYLSIRPVQEWKPIQ